MIKNNSYGHLLLWLLVIIALNLWHIFAGYPSSVTNAIQLNQLDFPIWMINLHGILVTSNLIFGVALIRWKKWGFWGLCITSFISLAGSWYTNLGLLNSFLDLGAIVILFSLLHFGGGHKAWNHLT